MHKDRFGDLRANGLHGVERGHRLLKNHPHRVAAHLAKVAFGSLQDISAVQLDLSRRLGPAW